MLPGLDTVPSTTTQQSNTDDSINSNSDNDASSGKLTTTTTATTAPLQSHTNGPSAEQLSAIRKLQKERGLKRMNSKYIGTIGNAKDIENCDERMIKLLTPKKGLAKIDKKITQIRYLLDQYKQQRPDIELEHTFDFKRAILEFIYNYFHVLSFPLIIYNEGINGFWSREMLSWPALIAWFCFMATNITFWQLSYETKQCFIFPFFVMNLLKIASMMVIATKYGYYPRTTFDEYSDWEHRISRDYLLSLHLVPGWLKQHPLTMAREFYLTEQRLGIDFSKLRMTFRDTKAFDLQKGANCSCSRYWTKMDWFIPYIYVYLTSGDSILTPRFFIWIIPFFMLLYYTTIARLLPWSLATATLDDCDTNCFILIGCLPVALGFGLWACWLWSVSMAFDFNRRYYRMKLCTHLLDPKRETFKGDSMRRSYKGHLFGSVSSLKAKKLKPLDLQTIDLYSSDTLFAWSQFRTILFDSGKMFLQREEAYNGLLIICTLLTLFFFLYSLVTDEIVVVWEDLIITLLLCIFVLAPSMWTLSCGNSLNYQTTKQQKILSERGVEMLHYQYIVEQKQMTFWVQELIKGQKMCDAIIDVLSQDEYSVTFLGIKVDNSVFQLIATIIGILLYISGWIVYQNWIKQSK